MKYKILIITILISILLISNKCMDFKDKPCTKENVYLAIKQSGIKYPDVVFAQIMLESANLQSKIVKSNNNLLGMKLPNKRPTTAIGEKNKYAVYNNWYESVIDYMLYQQNVMNNKNLNKKQYITYLNKKYSKTYDYKKRINKLLKENKLFFQYEDNLQKSI